MNLGIRLGTRQRSSWWVGRLSLLGGHTVTEVKQRNPWLWRQQAGKLYLSWWSTTSRNKWKTSKTCHNNNKIRKNLKTIITLPTKKRSLKAAPAKKTSNSKTQDLRSVNSNWKAKQHSKKSRHRCFSIKSFNWWIITGPNWTRRDQGLGKVARKRYVGHPKICRNKVARRGFRRSNRLKNFRNKVGRPRGFRNKEGRPRGSSRSSLLTDFRWCNLSRKHLCRRSLSLIKSMTSKLLSTTRLLLHSWSLPSTSSP